MPKRAMVGSVVVLVCLVVLLLLPKQVHALTYNFCLSEIDSTFATESTINVGVYYIEDGPFFSESFDNPTDYPYGYYFYKWRLMKAIHSNGTAPYNLYGSTKIGWEGDELTYHNTEAPQRLRINPVGFKGKFNGEVYLAVFDRVGPGSYERWQPFALDRGVLKLKGLGGNQYRVNDPKNDESQYLPDGTTLDLNNSSGTLWNQLKAVTCP